MSKGGFFHTSSTEVAFVDEKRKIPLTKSFAEEVHLEAAIKAATKIAAEREGVPVECLSNRLKKELGGDPRRIAEFTRDILGAVRTVGQEVLTVRERGR